MEITYTYKNEVKSVVVNIPEKLHVRFDLNSGVLIDASDTMTTYMNDPEDTFSYCEFLTKNDKLCAFYLYKLYVEMSNDAIQEFNEVQDSYDFDIRFIAKNLYMRADVKEVIEAPKITLMDIAGNIEQSDDFDRETKDALIVALNTLNNKVSS